MKVLLTVDTEVSKPLAPDWRETALRANLARDIHGETSAGSFGVGFQMDLLNRHGLRAAFFVEALMAEVVGREPLREIVDLVHRGGHEVQMHAHTEWLRLVADAPRAETRAGFIRGYDQETQQMLLGRALEHLRACGAEDVHAFRAGNYAADRRTLRALAALGLRYDTSHNAAHLGLACGLESLGMLKQPREVDGVVEVPVTWYRDRPGGVRPLQLCACSSEEMTRVLLDAWRSGWRVAVIVSHGFELIRRRPKPKPHRVVVRRFEALCRFLAENRDKFETCGFADLVPEDLAEPEPARALRSSLARTLRRYAEQAVGHIV